LFVKKPAFFVSVLAPNWGIRVKIQRILNLAEKGEPGHGRDELSRGVGQNMWAEKH
jgi:hypothetical protein